MQRLLSVIYRIHSIQVSGFKADLNIPGSITTGQFIPNGLNQATLLFSDGIQSFPFASLVNPDASLRFNPNLLRAVTNGGLVQSVHYSIDVLAGGDVKAPDIIMSELFRHEFPLERKEGAVMLRGRNLERWGSKLFQRTSFNTIFPRSPLKIAGHHLAQFAD